MSGGNFRGRTSSKLKKIYMTLIKTRNNDNEDMGRSAYMSNGCSLTNNQNYLP